LRRRDERGGPSRRTCLLDIEVGYRTAERIRENTEDAPGRIDEVLLVEGDGVRRPVDLEGEPLPAPVLLLTALSELPTIESLHWRATPPLRCLPGTKCSGRSGRQCSRRLSDRSLHACGSSGYARLRW